MSKRHAGDSNVPKEFFGTSVGLSFLDMSRTPLTAELLRAILTGLSSNHQVGWLLKTLLTHLALSRFFAALSGLVEVSIGIVGNIFISFDKKIKFYM